MKILAVADEESKYLWEYYEPSKLRDIDLIIGCGDLSRHYMNFLSDAAPVPVLYVHGNHDASYDREPPRGAICIDDDLYWYKGYRIVGLGGSCRYRAGAWQFTEAEMKRRISHELRTPLTSIKGWVETIANIRDPDDENYRKGITIIRSETDRLYDMVEELLDFSRLQNGIKLNCEVLDFVAEATDAALFVEARIRQEGLHLVYDEPPEPYPVWADPARLRQVFVNVFDNAIKYSPPEGTIFFTLTRTATTVTASIRDQGRGIAPDDLQNVKMKFFKAKNAVRGSGIGLAVVDEITKALGGTADITSTLGQGTTVTITLPIYHAGQEHLHEPL